MIKKFKIGPFKFSLSYPEGLIIPEHFNLFEVSDTCCDYGYELLFTDLFPAPSGKLMAQRPDLTVFMEGELESRYMGVKGRPGFYGCSVEIDSSLSRIYLASSFINSDMLDVVFTSLFSLERRLAALDAFVLHCAFIEHKGKAILFSAPSETGKTTQANLWAEYRGSRIINGDRALLQKMDGTWYACGWPVCGTSDTCFNENIPLGSIVTLSRSPSNYVETLPKVKSFSKLYPEITVNGWDSKRCDSAFQWLEKLIDQAYLLHLGCNISEDAVACLEAAISSGSSFNGQTSLDKI